LLPIGGAGNAACAAVLAIGNGADRVGAGSVADRDRAGPAAGAVARLRAGADRDGEVVAVGAARNGACIAGSGIAAPDGNAVVAGGAGIEDAMTIRPADGGAEGAQAVGVAAEPRAV
jgi:hypothetical protein